MVRPVRLRIDVGLWLSTVTEQILATRAVQEEHYYPLPRPGAAERYVLESRLPDLQIHIQARATDTSHTSVVALEGSAVNQ